MTEKQVAEVDREKFQQLNRVRADALEHARKAQELARQRRAMIVDLVKAGYSQSDIAREMNVSRQAVQKMLSVR